MRNRLRVSSLKVIIKPMHDNTNAISFKCWLISTFATIHNFILTIISAFWVTSVTSILDLWEYDLGVVELEALKDEEIVDGNQQNIVNIMLFNILLQYSG